MLGEALIDIVVPQRGDRSEHVGGSPTNVAIGLARLGHPTTLATHFGRDQRGERIRSLLATEGVALAFGSDTAARTSTALARLDDDQAATYEFDLDWRIDSDGVSESAAGTRHVHTGSIAATLLPGSATVAEVVASLRDSATVSYDPNARPSLMGEPGEAVAAIEDFVRLADVVKASDEDVAWLYAGATPQHAIDTWTSLGPGIVIITCGAQGALVHANGNTTKVPAAKVEVADTVGAGDSFMAGLVSGLLDAGLLGDAESRSRLARATIDDIRPAVDRALACSGITVSRVGANPPRRDELPA